MDIITKMLSYIEKNYKKFLYITIALFIVFAGIIGYNYYTKGYILNKSITISGGYLVLINNQQHISNTQIENVLYQMNITDYILYNTKDIIFIESPKNINETLLLQLLQSNYNINLSLKDISIQRYSSLIGNLIFTQFSQFVIIVMILTGIIIFLAFRTSNITLNIISTIAFDILGLLAILSLTNYPIGANGFI
ncbi:MAG: hypothetical protein ACP5G1_03330, partial [Nanopusillaceae archaeon]